VNQTDYAIAVVIDGWTHRRLIADKICEIVKSDVLANHFLFIFVLCRSVPAEQAFLYLKFSTTLSYWLFLLLRNLMTVHMIELIGSMHCKYKANELACCTVTYSPPSVLVSTLRCIINVIRYRLHQQPASAVGHYSLYIHAVCWRKKTMW